MVVLEDQDGDNAGDGDDNCAEMEFVTHVTHGGSVKFLPAV